MELHLDVVHNESTTNIFDNPSPDVETDAFVSSNCWSVTLIDPQNQPMPTYLARKLDGPLSKKVSATDAAEA